MYFYDTKRNKTISIYSTNYYIIKSIKMIGSGDSSKKTSSRHRKLISAHKKKPRPPDILRSIKSTNKLSAHNSSSKSSCQNIIKLKDISLTPGLPKPPGRLHISSAKKEIESSNISYGSVSTNGRMRIIKEIVGMTPNQEYGDDLNMELNMMKA